MKYKIVKVIDYPLKEEMKKRRVSVAALAKKLDMQRSYLHKIMAEGCGVSEKKAKNIIATLETYNV